MGRFKQQSKCRYGADKFRVSPGWRLQLSSDEFLRIQSSTHVHPCNITVSTPKNEICRNCRPSLLKKWSEKSPRSAGRGWRSRSPVFVSAASLLKTLLKHSEFPPLLTSSLLCRPHSASKSTVRLPGGRHVIWLCLLIWKKRVCKAPVYISEITQSDGESAQRNTCSRGLRRVGCGTVLKWQSCISPR